MLLNIDILNDDLLVGIILIDSYAPVTPDWEAEVLSNTGADPGIHQGGGGHCGGRKPAAGGKNFFTSRLLYVSFTSFLVN